MLDLRRNIEKVYSDMDPFWGKYADLNLAKVPQKSEIQEYQKTKIKMFSDQMKAQAGRKNARLNRMFSSGQINKLPEVYKKQENETLDKVIRNIVGLINWGSSARDRSTKAIDYETLNESLQALKGAINELNNLLEVNGGENIPGSYIDRINIALDACNIDSLDEGALDAWFTKLNNFKGDLVEDIGVAWLNTLKIPQVSSFTLNTGAIEYRDKSMKYGRQGQLIQDLMVLNGSLPEIKDIPISYNITGGDKINGTIGSMLSDIERASSAHKHIQLDDSGYSVLLQLSAINIQAKAGINQLPWNLSESTKVSIGEYANSDDNLEISIKHTFELLHELDHEPIPKQGIWVHNVSKDYSAMANYGVATIMAKVLHLNKYGNNYVLTPSGFITFSDRINELITKKNSYIYLKQDVNITDNTLGEKYDVGMVGYKN